MDYYILNVLYLLYLHMGNDCLLFYMYFDFCITSMLYYFV